MSLVSIIIPVYNVSKYIDKCLESIVCQTYQNIEIILVDDGSTDGSGEKCDKWTEKDTRIKVIHKENGGVSSARNAGLDNALGEYIMWADPDDYVKNTFVEKMHDAISKNNCEIAFCGFYIAYLNEILCKRPTFDTGVYDIKEIFNALFFEAKNTENSAMMTSLWSGIIKKDIIREENIRFDNNINICEDFLFYAEYICSCKKVAIINDCLYYYVQRESSIVHEKTSALDKLERTIYIYKKFCHIISENSEFKENLYMEFMLKKYVVKCVTYMLDIYSNESKTKQSTKFKQLKEFIDKSGIIKITHMIDIKGLSAKYRLSAQVLLTNNIQIICLWLRVINTFLFVKRKIKPVTSLKK